MTKAWCIWCETGSMPKHGYYWIHPECWEDIYAMASNIKGVDEFLKGERPRILANGDMVGYRTVEEFLVSMADFDRRSRNIMHLFKTMREAKLN